MSNIPYMVTEETLVFYGPDYTPYHVSKDRTAQFDAIVEELAKPNPDVQFMIEQVDLSKQVQAQFDAAVEESDSDDVPNYLAKGVIAVTRQGVTYNGEEIHGVLVDRMMAVLEAGLPIASWVRFAENVMMNPAEFSRDELYLWLETAEMPITSDGCFLAYKRVRNDYKDIHSGKFDNSVGQLVSLPGERAAVDADRARTCSTGLHFCSKQYLPSFGNGGGNRVMIVKVNPADVVSIPNDYGNSKGRTWRYEVVDEIDPEFVDAILYPPVVDDYDDEDDYGYVDPYDEDDYEDDLNDDLDSEIEGLIDGYGIVGLRNLASKHRGTVRTSEWVWKVASKEELATFIAQRRAGLV